MYDWPINILQMLMARAFAELYCISRHGWYALGKRTALLCIIFAFFNQGLVNKPFFDRINKLPEWFSVAILLINNKEAVKWHKKVIY